MLKQGVEFEEATNLLLELLLIQNQILKKQIVGVFTPPSLIIISLTLTD